MSINVTAVPKKSQEYPKLMHMKSTGLVVLFTTPTSGTVLRPSPQSRPLGSHSDGWDVRLFSEYEGSLTLENQND